MFNNRLIFKVPVVLYMVINYTVFIPELVYSIRIKKCLCSTFSFPQRDI